MMRLALTTLALTALAAVAQAGEPWIAAGDTRIRHDVQLLVDEGVINLPMSAWPISASDLAAALGSGASGALTPAQRAAVARLRKLAVEGRPQLGIEVSGAWEPTTLRTFEDTPREEGEVSAWISGFVGERWGGRLELTLLAGMDEELPDEDQYARLDGSYFAGKFGNWIVTAGAQDRWWGSGWEGSLILSNNARPVPALSLDRAVSKPFESKWLRWIGPWRLTTFMGYMDGERGDYDHPLLFGMRVSARPLDGLEISLERTAQWCGEDRSCDWSDFWNLWSGNDNAGENVDPEDEPGNQLAGWDIRWASPIGDWPYAVYFQHTGESIDNQLPRPYRSLELAGAEVWGGAADAASWRLALEWSLTRCGGTENGEKLWDCAYNSPVFNVDGYRYYDRPVGHSMDGDGEMFSLRYVRVDSGGATWSAVGRYTKVNQGGQVPDPSNFVAPGPEQWTSLDVIYRRPMRRGWIEVGAGAEQQQRDWDDSDELVGRAYLSWHQEF